MSNRLLPAGLRENVAGIYGDYKRRWVRWYGGAKMHCLGGYVADGGRAQYMPASVGNTYLRRALAGSGPFMAARYGTYELMAVAHHFYGYGTPDVMHRLSNNAGFFPKDVRLLGRFAETYANATRAVDCFAAWNFRHGLWPHEERVYRDFCPYAALTDIRAIRFLLHEKPWTAALAGKRVLVIHPFASTIERQYCRRADLFESPDVLPEFASIATIAAVQSAAGSEVDFPSWFEALGYMQGQMEKVDFDVALIGAGAYGLPLAAHAKQLGRQAVHMGGVTQMLFGIMGKRWEGSYGHLVNDAWTRPAEHEVPPKHESVEGGCYW